MGIYDRDYYRQERPAFTVGAPRTAIGVLLVINIAVWLLDFFTPVTGRDPETGEIVRRWLSGALGVTGNALTEPWMWWQFLTYGFVHSPGNFGHILWNMVALYLFGRDLEWQYGAKEFSRFYLAAVVLGGVIWAAIDQFQGGGGGHLIGASGAVTAVVLLFALNFPHSTILLFFVLPCPAWVLGVLIVAGNVFGAIGLFGTKVDGGQIAVSVHLVGAAFAFLYYRLGWNLGRLVGGRFRLPNLARRPKLRIHDPDRNTVPDLNEQVDRILEKITRQGEASLTSEERQTLESASRQFQRKRQQQQR